MGDNDDAIERARAGLAAAIKTIPDGAGAMVLVYLTPDARMGVCSWCPGDVSPPREMIHLMLEMAASYVDKGERFLVGVNDTPVQRPKGGV